MKGKWFLTKTGKVIVTPCRKNTTAARRKLKKFLGFLRAGTMTLAQIVCSYNSYRGYIKNDYNSHRTIRCMDKLFHGLFGWQVQINKKEAF
jgi:hypothetical protein